MISPIIIAGMPIKNLFAGSLRKSFVAKNPPMAMPITIRISRLLAFIVILLDIPTRLSGFPYCIPRCFTQALWQWLP